MESIENAFGIRLSDIPEVSQKIISKYNGQYSSGKNMKVGDQYLIGYSSHVNIEIILEVSEIGTKYEITSERKNNRPVLHLIS